ncbi:hypothetical protein THRCLA_07039 [Thraustotheca clavata]|uniref:Uncharacterized protein n=1 Tax=Thraustotheca clavata TaxID=74557 RepID=A0A1V9ZH09_9STRA|nr:hypothetical protein THRCLA_07039 [Thraustotheca clavata]
MASRSFAPKVAAWTRELFHAYLNENIPPFASFVWTSLDTLKAEGSSACHLRFLDKMQIERAREWTLDHVCYRCEEESEYMLLTNSILPTMGTLLIESHVGGRPIATFKLHQAIALEDGKAVDVLEVPMPKPGSFYKRGLEHAEVVVPFDLVQFIKAQKNESIKWDLKGMSKEFNREARIALADGISVKFHEQTLEDVIAQELKELKP